MKWWKGTFCFMWNPLFVNLVSLFACFVIFSDLYRELWQEYNQRKQVGSAHLHSFLSSSSKNVPWTYLLETWIIWLSNRLAQSYVISTENFTQSNHWPHESTAKEMHGWRIAICSAFDSPYWPGVVSKLLFSLLWGIFWRFSVFPSPQKAIPQI